MRPFNRSYNALIVFLLLYFIETNISIAQSYPDLFFSNVTEKNGLSSNRVNKIIRDHQGFIWFATENGLNRFDGYNMKVYKNIPGDSTSLLNNFVITVFEDSKNNLWLGTTEAISVYDREQDGFVHYRHKEIDSTTISDGNMECFFEDNKHKLWIASTGGGLNLFDNEKKTFHHYIPSPVGLNSTLYKSQLRINEITGDKDGTLWMASYDGLARFNPSTNHFDFFVYKPEDIPNRSFNNLVVSVLQDNSNPGIIWYGTWGSGLHRFNKETKAIEVFKYNTGLPPNLSNIIFDIEVRDDSTLWITSENGLGIFNKRNGLFFFYHHQPDNEHSLISNSVKSVYTDYTGLTWIATGNGISIIDPNLQRFRFRELVSGPGNGDLIFDVKQNKIYRKNIYSSRNLLVYDVQTTKTDLFPIPHADEMKSEPFGFFIDSKGIIWIGTTKTGVYQFNPATSKFTKLETEKALHIPDAKLYINNFLEDKNGNIWLASFGYGMIEYHPKEKTFTRFCNDMNAPHRTLNNNCVKLFSDTKGNVWGVFERFGLSKYDISKDSVSSYNYSENEYYKNFYELSDAVIDSQNRIWIASNTNGLVCFDEQQPLEKSVKVFNSSVNFPGNSLLNLVCDNNNNLWISHKEGLIYFDTRTFESKNFTSADGLPATNINAALYNPGNDEIWFSYKSGYYYFRPGEFKKDTIAPEIILNSFKVFDKEVSKGNKLVELSKIDLKHNENFISFEFSVLNFTNPSGVRYAYKLDGIDKDWIHSGRRRFASYTDLDPGNYTLHLKAANSDGVWNEKGKTIAINILPAWWQVVWFKISAVLILLLVTYYSIRFFTTRKLQRQLEEAEKQKEIAVIRTRISRDMHDDIGSGLTKISLISSRMKLENKNQAMQPLLEKIETISREVTGNLGEIVWAVNPQSDNLQSFIGFLRDYAFKFFDESGITLKIDFPEAVPFLVVKPDVKRNVFLVYKEALNNVLKHAEAKNVIVKMIVNENKFSVDISDDGKGFDFRADSPGNGLKNMKKRIEYINGDYSVSSTVNGTATNFDVPI